MTENGGEPGHHHKGFTEGCMMEPEAVIGDSGR